MEKRFEVYQGSKGNDERIVHNSFDNVRDAIRVLSFLLADRNFNNVDMTYYLDDCQKDICLFTATKENGIRASIEVVELLEK